MKRIVRILVYEGEDTAVFYQLSKSLADGVHEGIGGGVRLSVCTVPEIEQPENGVTIVSGGVRPLSENFSVLERVDAEDNETTSDGT